jgi:S-adenosylmethionine:tRNA ribosyltransferase-isomerase
MPIAPPEPRACPEPQATRDWSVDDFDFDLPTELIAQYPTAERAASRLLDGRCDPAVHRQFRELPALLEPGDLMVFNDTRVIKARLFGRKPSGGRLEMLIERVLDGAEVAAHMKVSKKPTVGTVLQMDGGFEARVLGRWPHEAGPLFRLALSADPYQLMSAHGHVPLPPYIDHEDGADDEERYQTVFAAKPGAVAAPTAALHFDQATLDAMQARGIERSQITLHVGAGTFQPVKTERIADHLMHHERFEVPAATHEAIVRCKARGGRVLAVGTTTVRALESAAHFGPDCGDTNIFITPGFEFKAVDMLLTNFHLPKSTLMMLVSAFAGHAHIMDLYRQAVAERYRFFSYGDAMLLSLAPRG